MMQDTAKLAVIAGLIVNMAGVMILFRYGMPYRIATGRDSALLLEGSDKEAVRIEARYRAVGWVGISLIIVGTILQAWSVIAA